MTERKADIEIGPTEGEGVSTFTDQVQERIDRLERMEPVFNDLLAALETAPEPRGCNHGTGHMACWYHGIRAAALAKVREVKP